MGNPSIRVYEGTHHVEARDLAQAVADSSTEAIIEFFNFFEQCHQTQYGNDSDGEEQRRISRGLGLAARNYLVKLAELERGKAGT